MIQIVTIKLTPKEVATALEEAVRKTYQFSDGFKPCLFAEPAIEMVDGAATLTYHEDEEPATTEPSVPCCCKPSNPPTKA